MGGLWSFLRQKRNRDVLGWIGGGAVVVTAGVWAVFTFFWTPSPLSQTDGPQTNVEATGGGVAIGGDVSGSKIQTGTAPAAE
jgi:hypothetical protein